MAASRSPPPAVVHGSGRLTRRCFAGKWVREVSPGGGVQHQPPWLDRRQTHEHYMPASPQPASAFRLEAPSSSLLRTRILPDAPDDAVSAPYCCGN
ncbi:hypothetical protein Taro_025565 [Colocasia esculenta]|uniref:Uncharacterized protein n=1 Tax=Colocasia esculenta TaxID=4460 RepID=A0A843V9Q4_COLES|nr:hypothetical protein [Colocasia esculenta]